MVVCVRDARPGDAARIEPLLAACRGAEGWSEANVGGRSTPDRTVPHVDLIAEADGRVVGWLAGDIIFAPNASGDILPMKPYRGHVLDMAVHPDFRRRGVGRRLVQEALARYRRQGCVRVELGCGSPSAGRFYLACGGGLMRDEDHPTGGITGTFEWVL